MGGACGVFGKWAEMGVVESRVMESNISPGPAISKISSKNTFYRVKPTNSSQKSDQIFAELSVMIFIVTVAV